MGTTGELGDRELRLPLEEAEWWGAALAVLVAVFHHPHLLAERQPDTDPVAIAREVRGRLDELADAITGAVGAGPPPPRSWWQETAVRREREEIVFSPAQEVGSLGLCLEVFADAVLEPDGPQARIECVKSDWPHRAHVIWPQ